jgi:hypothetical protein
MIWGVSKSLQSVLANPSREAWSECSIFVRHLWNATAFIAILSAIAWCGTGEVLPRTNAASHPQRSREPEPAFSE